MNRKSLFGRLTASTIASRFAERQEYLRLQMEPLEDRKLLTVDTTYVNDNWFDFDTSDGFVHPGDTVQNTNDPSAPFIQAFYGSDAFGKVTSWSGGAINGDGAGIQADWKTIHGAIQATNGNGALNLLRGTYTESDIVIDHPMQFLGEGSGLSLIQPEVASDHTSPADFSANTHSGIIIYSPSVTISNVGLNGNGNSGVTGTLAYHQGITTLYTTQAGGDYQSLHNGSLPIIQLGSGGARTIPAIEIDHVAVSNVFFHGITLSARSGESFGTSNGSGLNIDSSTVTNVGVNGSQTLDNIGILVQNLDNDPFPGPVDGDVRFSTVTNAGVGIESNALGTYTDGSHGGTKLFGNSAGGRNKTGFISNTVTNATLQGYHIEFLDSGEGMRNNVATFLPGNNADGVYVNFSQALMTGFQISGAKVGVHIQNTPFTGSNVAILGVGGNVLTGPGTGIAGSVGVLIDNSASETDSSAVIVGTGTAITGYQTGIKAVQNFADTVPSLADFDFNPGNGLQPTISQVDTIHVTIGSVTFGTNGTDIDVGNGVLLDGGNVSRTTNLPAPKLNVSGAAIIDPSVANWNNYYYNGVAPSTGTNVTPIALMNPEASTVSTGNLTLNASSTFQPRMVNQSGTTPLFNFNAAVNYPFAIPPDAPANAIVPAPNGVLFNWYGNLTQDGTGTIVLGGTATNGKGLDFAFGSNYIPAGPGLFQLVGTDISNMTTLNIKIKASVATTQDTFDIGIFDVRGNANLYQFKYSDINSTAYTTLQVNLLAPSVNLTGPDDHMDLTKVAGWVFGGDQGAINTNQNVPFGFVVDDMFATSTVNSQLKVNGTVNLNGANLSESLDPFFVPSAGQVFTLIDKTSAGAVTGTFNALPEGATTVIGGHTFQISYIGGDGNNVTLTEVSPILDLNGTGAGTGFTVDWNKQLATPVNISNAAAATLTDDGANLVSLTATIANPHSGDLLSANTGGTSISQTYNAGTHVLTLSGSDTVANYQGVLRTIKYNNNVLGGPGVSPVIVNFVATDTDAHTSAVATALVTDPAPQLHLGTGASQNATAAWTVGGGPVAIEDPAAFITDADDPNLTSLTVQIRDPLASAPPITPGSPNPNDILAANTSGTSITASWNGVDTLFLTGVDTLANYNQVLQSITYDSVANSDPGTSSVQVAFTANDGVVNSVTAVSNVSVTLKLNVDLNGTGTGVDRTTSWVGAGAIFLADTAGATLLDTRVTADTTVTQLTAHIADPHTGDILAATASGGITVSWDSGGNTLFMVGNAPASSYQTVLRTVTYNNTSGGPGAITNASQVHVDFLAQDGVLTSRNARTTINVPPVIDLGGTATGGLNYTTTWSGAQISATDANATIFDGGRQKFDFMTVKIVSDATSHIVDFHVGDVLSINTAGTSLTSTYANGVLTIASTSATTQPYSQYQTVLRTLKYNNTSHGPGAGPQIFLEVQADDGGLKNDVLTGVGALFTLPVTTININVNPNVDLNGTAASGNNFITTWSNSGAVPIESTSLAVLSDPGGPGTLANMTVTVKGGVHSGDVLSAVTTGTPITSTYNAVTGVLTLSGTTTLANYQTVLRTVKYNNTSPFGGPGTNSVKVTFNIDNGTFKSNAAEATLVIQSPLALDLDGVHNTNPPTDRQYTTTWTNAGAVNVMNSGTIKDGESSTLSALQVAVFGAAPGDVLFAQQAGTNIQISGNGTSILTLNGFESLTDYQTVMNTIQYINTNGGPAAPQVLLKVTAQDSFTNTDDSDQLFTTVLIQAPPVLDLNGDGVNTSYATSWLNTGAVNITDTANAAVKGGEGPNLVSLTATIGTLHTGDVLSANTAGTTVTASYNSGTGVLTLSGNRPQSEYQTVLRTVKYNNTNGGPGVGSVTVNFVGSDGTLSSVAVSSTISINAANVAPTLDLNGGGAGTGYSTTWSNAGAVNISDTAAAVTGDDSGNLASMTVTLGTLHAGDVLAANTAGTTVTASYNSGTGVLTLSGNRPTSEYQTVLRTVTYNNSGPVNAASISVNFVANDGSLLSPTATATITVAPVAIDLNGVTAGTGFTATWANAGAVNITGSASATVLDAQTGTISSLTAVIPVAQTGGVLSATTTGTPITVTYNSGTRTLTLSGAATVAQYQQVLRTVKYNNTNANGPAVTTFNVNFTATDSLANVSNATATVNIATPPVVDLNGAAGGTGFTSTWANTGAVNIVDSIVGIVSDNQSPNLTSMTATIVGLQAGDVLNPGTATTGITSTYNAGTGVLTLSGNTTVANYQTALRKITYNNTSGGQNVTSRTINFVGTDGISNSATSVATVTIQPLLLDLNGTATLGTGYTNFWTNTGAVAIDASAAAAVLDGKATNLTSLTATITSVNANNVLAATASGGVAVTYNAGTNVLTLSGSASPAAYQTVLRTITYNNTAGGPGAGPVTINLQATDANAATSSATSTIKVILAGAQVVSRNLFYNQSGDGTHYDHNSAAIDSNDDAAIAIDKTAYIPNGTAATFSNVSSYSKGINGIMIDIGGTHGTITLADFTFRVGNNNSPTLWTSPAAPTPSGFSVRAGAGVGGSDRVEITWANGAIAKKWLEVIVAANGNTGLSQLAGAAAGTGDVFFWGSAVGDSGLADTATLATVDSNDELEARNHQQGLITNVPITNIRDYNRDAIVDSNDGLVSRNNPTTVTTATKFINVALASAAPEGGDTGPVASALTAPTATSSAAPAPNWLVNRLESIDLNNGIAARLFQHLADQNTPGTRKLLVKIDEVTDALGLDDTLLDNLLADLGLE